MKTLFLLSLILPFSALASPADPVPDCWTENGESMGLNREGMEIADGHFIVRVDTEKSTVASLLSTLEKADKGNLHALRYPLIFSHHLYIFTQALDNQIPRVDRTTLKVTVMKQLTELVKLEGITLDCDQIAHPARGRL